MPHLVRQPGQRTRAAGNARCAAVLWEWRALRHGEEQQERHPLQGWGERCGLGGLSCWLAAEHRGPQEPVLGLDECEAVREHVGVLGEERDIALEKLDVLLGDFAGTLGREPFLQHPLRFCRVAVVPTARRGMHGRRRRHRARSGRFVFTGLPSAATAPLGRAFVAGLEGRSRLGSVLLRDTAWVRRGCSAVLPVCLCVGSAQSAAHSCAEHKCSRIL